ncbi:hypothetical protein M408DRAFT_28815, partial [Serendipita vermifera MAFF 305830]
VHTEAKWRERKEKNQHEESGVEKKDEKKEKDEARNTAESFTDPIAMTYDESDDKKAGGKEGNREKDADDGNVFGAFASDSMASLTSAMKGRTFGQPSPQ